MPSKLDLSKRQKIDMKYNFMVLENNEWKMADKKQNFAKLLKEIGTFLYLCKASVFSCYLTR